MAMLHVIDSRWKDHLYGMDCLKEGIGLRAYGARDPLIEYQKEAYNMFVEMMERIKDDVVELVFRMQILEQKELRGVFTSLPQKTEHREFGGLSATSAQVRMSQEDEGGASREEAPAPSRTVRHEGPKVGRNDPCPCGSGKKYKKCCGANG